MPHNIAVAHRGTYKPTEAKALAFSSYTSPARAILVPVCGFPSDVPTWLRYELANIGASCGEQKELAYIAKHESTYNPEAKNPTSSARGLMQFLDSSFINYGCGRYGGRASSRGQLICSLNIMRTEGAYNTWYKYWQ